MNIQIPAIAILVVCLFIKLGFADEPGALASPPEAPATPAPKDQVIPFAVTPAAPVPSAIPSRLLLRDPGVFLPSITAIRHLETGAYLRQDDLLPSAQDPNDLQAQQADGYDSMQAFRIGFEEYGQPLTLEIGFQARPGMYYDSGFAGSTSGAVVNPANIALDGSVEAHRRGQLTFRPDGNTVHGFVVPIRPEIGVQLTDFAGMGSVQGNLDTYAPNGDDLEARSAFLRYVNPDETLAVSFGKMETLFGDLGTVPSTITTGALPVGSVTATSNDKSTFIGVPQFRLARISRGVIDAEDLFELSLSAEDASVFSEITYPAAVTRLNRYPTVVGRIRYGGENGFDSYQLAALVRPLGFETNSNFREHFNTGWGFSANVRFDLGDTRTDTVYLGAVGGRGIGGYIYGGTPSALILGANEFDLFWNAGAFASYRRVWTVQKNGNWSSNFIFGTVLGERATAADNRRLYQAGCNLLWNSGKNSAAGIEYQYGSRTTADDRFGDNHRIMLVFQFGTAPAAKVSDASTPTNILSRTSTPPSPISESTKSRLRL